LDYSQLIKNWHLKAAEQDYFSKFIFEYLAFIAYLKTIKYIPADPASTFHDRDVIQKLKSDEDLKSRYLRIVDENPIIRLAWQELKLELDKKPLGNVSRNPSRVSEIEYWNCSHEKLTQKTPGEKALVCGVLHSLTDWENMVEFWYSIRNNLFHGAKDPEIERDQMVVRIGYVTLSRFMDMFV
jgi:hypothetical protein